MADKNCNLQMLFNESLRLVANGIAHLNDPETLVLHGDAREVAQQLSYRNIDAKLEAVEFDLVFTDPPFNIGDDYEGFEDKETQADYFDKLESVIIDTIEFLREGGTLALNLPCNVAFPIWSFIDTFDDMTFIRDCIWHYRFGQNIRSNFISSHVHCLIFVKGDVSKRTWNPDDILVNSDRAEVYNDPRTYNKADGSPDGKRVPLDVFEFPRVQGNNKERRVGHPNQMPELYAERIIRAFTNPGDLVLDLYAGSGTIGTVARALNRRSLSVEVSLKSAESAARRIKEGAVRVGKPKRVSKPRRKNRCVK